MNQREQEMLYRLPFVQSRRGNKQLLVYFRSKRSNSCNIFRPRSCLVLGSEQEGWETPRLIGNGRLKWGASALILMRSARMKSLKQLPSFPFLDVCATTANRVCHAFYRYPHYL